MAEEGTPAEPPEETSKEASEGSGLSSMIGKLSSAEKFLVAGAAILVADYLLFELILGEYSFFVITLLIAAYALLAVWVRHNRPSVAWPIPYDYLMRVLGLSAGFLGSIELFTDIRFTLLDEAVEVFGGLFTYAAAFLMFWGALQLKDSSDS